MSKPINPKPCPFCGYKGIDISRGITGATVSFDNMATNAMPGLAIMHWNCRNPEREEQDGSN